MQASVANRHAHTVQRNLSDEDGELSRMGPARIDRGVWLKIRQNPADPFQKIIQARVGQALESRETLNPNMPRKRPKTADKQREKRPGG